MMRSHLYQMRYSNMWMNNKNEIESFLFNTVFNTSYSHYAIHNDNAFQHLGLAQNTHEEPIRLDHQSNEIESSIFNRYSYLLSGLRMLRVLLLETNPNGHLMRWGGTQKHHKNFYLQSFLRFEKVTSTSSTYLLLYTHPIEMISIIKLYEDPTLGQWGKNSYLRWKKRSV